MKFGIVPVTLVAAHLSMKSVPDFLACQTAEGLNLRAWWCRWL